MTQEENGLSKPVRYLLWGMVLAGLAAAGWMIAPKFSTSVPTPVASNAGVGGADPLVALQQAAQKDASNAGAQIALGRAYFDSGRFDEAITAYEAATKADASSAQGWSGLGEARVMASRRDPMPPAALEAFRKAIAVDPKDPRARYFLAVKRDLDGDHQGAIADWMKLLADTPPGAPWEDDLKRTIEQVGKINKIDVTGQMATASKSDQRTTVVAPAIPGPSQQDLLAASKIPPSEQRQMAEGMVSRLEQRLASNPGNVDGWLMLIRSRMTLEQPELAKQAMTKAISANPAAEAQIRQQAEMLGVR